VREENVQTAERAIGVCMQGESEKAGRSVPSMEEQEMKFCRMCGEKIKADTRFCRYCGYEFQNVAQPKEEDESPKETVRVCEKCGNEVNPQATFCKYCGSELGQQEETPKQEPPKQETREAQEKQDIQKRELAIQEVESNVRSNPENNLTQQVPQHKTNPAPQKQGQKPKTIEKKKKKKSKMPAVIGFVAVILIAVGVISNFWPKDPKDGKGNKDWRTGNTAGKNNGNQGDTGIVATEENSPGNPRFISVRYSKGELEKASSESAEVSTRQCNVTVGDMEFELPPWNLSEEGEKLIVKELPKKTISTTGEEFYGYDFSLSSGTHDLGTCAKITMPRKAGNKEGRVVYYNQETNEWEPVYYEVSEDGKSYVVYTYHFSIYGEVIGQTEEQYDLSDEYYYETCFKKVYGKDGTTPLHQERVTVDERVLEKLVSKPIEKTGADLLRHQTGSQDVIAEENAVPVFFAACDATNNYVMGWLLTVGNQFTQTFHELQHTKVFGAVGGGLTLVKVGYQIYQGKSTNEVISENKADIIGTCISAMTVHAELAGAEIAKAGLGWAGVAVFVGYKVYDYYETLDKTYSEFLPQNKYEAIAAYYNDKYANYKGKELSYVLERGFDPNIDPTASHTVSAYSNYTVNDRKYYPIIKEIIEKNVYDTEQMVWEFDQFYKAFHEPFYLLSEEEQWNYIYKLVNTKEELQAFLDSQFTHALSDGEKEELKNNLDGGFNQQILHELLHNGTDESGYNGHILAYKERSEKLAKFCTGEIMKNLSFLYCVKAMEAVKKSMYDEILPVMNKMVFIEVIDQRENSPELTFDRSPYANFEWYKAISKMDNTVFDKKTPYSFVGTQKQFYDTTAIPMYFADITVPGFYPTNVRDKSEYEPSTYILHPTEGSNEVFCCRYFDYLMVGAPHVITFNGDESNAKLSKNLVMEDGFGSKSNLYTGTILLSSVNAIFSPMDITCELSQYRLFDTNIADARDDKTVRFTVDKEGNFSIHMDALLVDDGGNTLIDANAFDISGKLENKEGSVSGSIDFIGADSLAFRKDYTFNDDVITIASAGGKNVEESETTEKAILGSDKGKITVKQEKEEDTVILVFTVSIIPHHVEVHYVAKNSDGSLNTEDTIYESDSSYNAVELIFKYDTGKDSFTW